MNPPTSIRSFALFCLLGLIPLTANADLPLENIPADAHVIATVRDIGALESELEAFFNNSNMPRPEGLNLSTLLSTVGASEVVQSDRGLAVVMLAAEPDGLIVYVPVENSEAALESLNAAVDGSHHRFMVGGSETLAYAVGRQKWLLVALNAEVLETLGGSEESIASNWPAARQREMLASDFFVHVDLQRWGPSLVKGLDELSDQLTKLGVEQELAVPGVDMMEFVQWELQAVKSFVEQTESVSVAVSVDSARLLSQMRINFAKGSYLRALAKAQPDPRSNLLGRLPDHPFLMAVGLDTQKLNQFLVDATRSMVELPEFGKLLRHEQFKDVLEQSLEMYSGLQGFNFTFGLGPAGMESVGHYFYDDPEAVRDHWQAEMRMGLAMLQTFGLEGATANTQRKKVGNLDVDEFTFDLGDAKSEMSEAVRAIYGPRLRVQYTVKAKSLAFAMGNSPDPIRVIEHPGSPLVESSRVRMILDELPRRPVGIVLVDPLSFVAMLERTLAGLAATENTQTVPTKSPEDERVPPIGLALTANQSGYTIHSVVRAETIKAVIQRGQHFPVPASASEAGQ